MNAMYLILIMLAMGTVMLASCTKAIDTNTSPEPPSTGPGGNAQEPSRQPMNAISVDTAALNDTDATSSDITSDVTAAQKDLDDW